MGALDEATRYIGYGESSHPEKIEKLIGFDPRKQSWCAAWVNAMEKKCGRPGTGSLMARSYLKYGVAVKNPQPGDIVVLKRGTSAWQGHVAYYVSEDDTRVYLLGGNQDNEVKYKWYPKSKVLGYRRP